MSHVGQGSNFLSLKYLTGKLHTPQEQWLPRGLGMHLTLNPGDSKCAGSPPSPAPLDLPASLISLRQCSWRVAEQFWRESLLTALPTFTLILSPQSRGIF